MAIAYDTFFSNKDTKQLEKNLISFDQLSSLNQFIVKFSDDAPFLYGTFAILLAIILGIFGAALRRILSKYKHLFIFKKKIGT